jgi:hypothetical protein
MRRLVDCSLSRSNNVLGFAWPNSVRTESKGAEKAPADMINQIRQELSTDPVQDDWVQWIRWFLADPAKRTISPFSQLTVSNYVEQKINEHTDASLRVAEQLSFGNPELTKRVDDALSALHQNKQP